MFGRRHQARADTQEMRVDPFPSIARAVACAADRYCVIAERRSTCLCLLVLNVRERGVGAVSRTRKGSAFPSSGHEVLTWPGVLVQKNNTFVASSPPFFGHFAKISQLCSLACRPRSGRAAAGYRRGRPAFALWSASRAGEPRSRTPARDGRGGQAVSASSRPTPAARRHRAAAPSGCARCRSA